MDCLAPSTAQSVIRFDGDDQLIGVDSGLIAIVDEQSVDDFVETVAPIIDGRQALELPGFARFGNGFLYNVDSDGGYAQAAYATQTATVAFEIGYDLYDDTDLWIPAGVFPVPSGIAVAADPATSPSTYPTRSHHRPPPTARGPYWPSPARAGWPCTSARSKAASTARTSPCEPNG
jgi:hypothetical protein